VPVYGPQQNGLANKMDFWFRLSLRIRLGIISVVLVILAAVSIFFWVSDPVHNRPISGLIKFAPILLLLWIAWADLKKVPMWVWCVAPFVIIFCLIKPAAWLVVIPVTLFCYFVAKA
jgi:hypothetical protein